MEYKKEDFKALSILHEFAKENQLSYKIEYSECDDNWGITMDGAGIGEHFYSGKKIAGLKNAIEYVIIDAKKLYDK